MYGQTKFAFRKNSRFKLRKFLFYLFNPTIIFQSSDAKAKIVWNSKCVNAKLQGQKHSSLRKNTILWNNEHSCFIQTRLMNPHEELYSTVQGYVCGLGVFGAVYVCVSVLILVVVQDFPWRTVPEICSTYSHFKRIQISFTIYEMQNL